MHKPDIFHTFQAEIAGIPYLAIPREAGSAKRVDIHVLFHPDMGVVTSATVSEDGRIIEAARLAVGTHGDEPSRNACGSSGLYRATPFRNESWRTAIGGTRVRLTSPPAG